MPSRTRCGSSSITLRSMNAPGSPSSPLQMTYFWREVALATVFHFRPVGIARAATATQAAARDLVDHLDGRHVGERLDGSVVPAPRDVLFDALRVLAAAAFEHDAFLAGKERRFGRNVQPLDGCIVQVLDDLVRVFRLDVLIAHIFGHGHHRAGGAQTLAAAAR